MNQYKNIVSLGYICSIYAYKVQTLKKKDRQSMVFDHVGVPMWAVHDLIKNDFNDFVNEDHVEKRKLFEDSDKEFWIDNKYYTRFLFNPLKIFIMMLQL